MVKFRNIILVIGCGKTMPGYLEISQVSQTLYKMALCPFWVIAFLHVFWHNCSNISEESKKFYDGCLEMAYKFSRQRDMATVHIAIGSMYTNAKVKRYL